MNESSILEIKHSNKTNFVGIKIINNTPKIFFPLGYDIEEHEIELNKPSSYEKVKNVKKDIMFLLNSLKRCLNKDDGEQIELNNYYKKYIFFPFFACYEILIDYIQNGYFQEDEKIYLKSNSGKINWNRTIKKIQPILQEKSFIYTNFIVKKSQTNLNSIIRQIHRYCVYDCNKKIGFLFGNLHIEKPKIEFNKNFFLETLKEKLLNTFNDEKKKLLRNLISYISGLDQENSNNIVMEYGTYNYQVVWEKMINIMFKQREKDKFYPSGKLYINNKIAKTSNLKMDTIYINFNKVLVIDAKYYKFGLSPTPDKSLSNNDQYNLPAFSDINKQITYAEYVEYMYTKEKQLFFPLRCETNDIGKNIRNIFILPFNKNNNAFSNNSEIIHYIGYAEADWKKEMLGKDKDYYKVHMILIDTKWLIKNYNQIENEKIDKEIDNLEKIIDNYMININKLIEK